MQAEVSQTVWIAAITVGMTLGIYATALAIKIMRDIGGLTEHVKSQNGRIDRLEKDLRTVDDHVREIQQKRIA